MPITQSDGQSTQDAEELFFNHFTKDLPKEKEGASGDDEEPEKKVRSDTEDDHTAEDDHDEPEERDEDAEEPSEDDDQESDKPAKRYLDDDDAFVKIKVGDEEQEHSLKSLKRLAGQEAALTQKSQQLAVKRKDVEQQEATHQAASHALLTMARQRYEPYSKIDFLLLQRDPAVTNEQLQALRDEAQTRYEEVKFLEEQTGQYMQALNQRKHEERVATAQATVKELANEDSPYHIEGFNEEVYSGLTTFAISQGLSRDMVNSIIDAPALKLLSMAKKYVEGLSKVTTTKVNKTVKKVVKTSKSMSASERMGKGNDKAMAQFLKTGSVDDATNVFLARFKELGGVE